MQSDPSHGNSVDTSKSARWSDSEFVAYKYQFTSCPLPDDGIVSVCAPKTQAHLWPADRYVEKGVAVHQVADNRNNRFWMPFPIRSTEDV